MLSWNVPMLHLFEILTDSAPITSDMSLPVLFFPALVRLGQEETRVYKLFGWPAQKPRGAAHEVWRFACCSGTRVCAWRHKSAVRSWTCACELVPKLPRPGLVMPLQLLPFIWQGKERLPAGWSFIHMQIDLPLLVESRLPSATDLYYHKSEICFFCLKEMV